MGTNIGDVNIAFAKRRVIVAELFNGIVWRELIRSSIRISTTVYTTTPDYAVNMKAQLLPGRNYTELNTLLGLAYGYYQYWLPFIQTSGLSVLRESRIKIYNAFAIGRQAPPKFAIRGSTSLSCAY